MKCHLCSGELNKAPILDLKGMPKAAQYYPEKREFPSDKGITLAVFQCPWCGLVQLTCKPVSYFREVITAASLMGKSRQSRLDQMKELVQKFDLAGKNVLEVGSGKGELLDVMSEAGMVPSGLEAAPASVKIGRAAGRNLIQGYIGEVAKIKGAPFAAFVCLNYLEHLPQPGRIIRQIHKLTDEQAVGFVTVPNLNYLLMTKSYYEFVADHLSYFTQQTLALAFEANGFEVLDCRLINNENDIAVTVRKRMAIDLTVDYAEVETLLAELRRLADDYKAKGRRIAVWGAGHRTLALLALAGLRDLAYVVDSAPFKQGKFTPILHRKIVPPDQLKVDPVDLLIVMVPGIYPDEVIKAVKSMNTGAKLAKLVDNRIEYIN